VHTRRTRAMGWGIGSLHSSSRLPQPRIDHQTRTAEHHIKKCELLYNNIYKESKCCFNLYELTHMDEEQKVLREVGC
jgi:hypothetical protein